MPCGRLDSDNTISTCGVLTEQYVSQISEKLGRFAPALDLFLRAGVAPFNFCIQLRERFRLLWLLLIFVACARTTFPLRIWMFFWHWGLTLWLIAALQLRAFSARRRRFAGSLRPSVLRSVQASTFMRAVLRPVLNLAFPPWFCTTRHAGLHGLSDSELPLAELRHRSATEEPIPTLGATAKRAISF